MSIVLANVTKHYDATAVVDRVSLDIADGELFVLLGPSGSGKSTILRMIAGLTEITSGQIFLHGRDVTALSTQERGVGFVFQHYALFPHMTVAENVEFGLRVRRVPTAERRKQRDRLLELVGLAGLAQRLPRQLSGGQQQRVALARALAPSPAVLLLDEPFGALDTQIRLELRRSLRQVQRELGITAIFVTHDQEEAFELGDRLGVMSNGQLLEVGTPQSLYLQPRTLFAAAFIGAANVLPAERTATGARLGSLQTALPEPGPDSDQEIQVVFRPEDVIIAASADDLGDMLVGQAIVEQQIFVGAFERLRLRVITGLPQVKQGEDPEDRSIEATRLQEQARNYPLRPADLVWVGITRLHAIPIAADTRHPLSLHTDTQPSDRSTAVSHGLLSHG